MGVILESFFPWEVSLEWRLKDKQDFKGGKTGIPGRRLEKGCEKRRNHRAGLSVCGVWSAVMRSEIKLAG